MFILSALDKRGSFHAAKVIIFTRICNFYRQKKRGNLRMRLPPFSDSF